MYANPLFVFTPIFSFVGGILFWMFLGLPATLFTTDTYRSFVRDVLLPLIQWIASWIGVPIALLQS